MPSKYDHITSQLPRLAGAISDDPGYQGLVELVKAQILESVVGNTDLTHNDRQRVLDRLNNDLTIVHQSVLHACADGRASSDYVRTYLELRDLKDRIAGWLSNANLLLEAYTQLMLDQMEAEGTGTLKLENGRGVSTYLEPYPTVKDKEAFRVWCLEQGFASLMHLHPGTTKTTVKKMLEAGEAAPPGVEVNAKPTVRLVGGKE